MHCRVFDLRLGTHRDADQGTLNSFLDHVDVVSTTATLVNTTTQFWSVLVFYKELSSPKREERSVIANEDQPANQPEGRQPEQIDLDPPQQQMYDKLRQWRSTQAQTEGVPVYVVAHNSMLQQIARRGISSREELLQIARFGPKRVEKYGDALLNVLTADQQDV